MYKFDEEEIKKIEEVFGTCSYEETRKAIIAIQQYFSKDDETVDAFLEYLTKKLNALSENNENMWEYSAKDSGSK